jgi:hypothetical protein
MTPNFSFQLRPVTYQGKVVPKCETIIYEEPDHKLVIEFDISGVPQFDLCCDDVQFQKWTEPAGKPIPKEKQEEIIKRMRHWARTEKGLRLDIGPGVDFVAYMEKQGFIPERRPDGTTVFKRPNRKK